MNRIGLALLAAAALLAGCGGDRALTPSDDETTLPSAQIVDGANSGGNKDFFFLPPVVSNPNGKPGFKDDAFNPNYQPIVEICPLTTAGTITDANADGRCDNPATNGVFSGAQIAVSTGEELYSVNWNTGLSNLNLSVNYRIRVLIGNVELGHADVDPINTGKMKNETTGDLIPLVDGRNLPIKFRIEVGALTTVDDQPGGGQYAEKVVTNNGNDAGGAGTVVLSNPTAPIAGGFFPDGWLTGQPVSQVIVTVEEIRVANPADCHGTANAPQLLQFGKCIRYSTIPRLAPLPNATGGQQFAVGVVVGFCRDLATTAPNYDALRVWKSETGVADAPVTTNPRIYQQYFLLACDPTGNTASAPSSGLRGRIEAGWQMVASALSSLLGPTTAYAIDLGIGGEAFGFSDFDFGMVPIVTAAATNATTAAAGAVVPLTFTVTAPHETHAQVPVPNVPVTFALVSGTANLGSTTATTNAAGQVTLSATLGAATANTVVVRATILSGLALNGQVAFDTVTVGTTAPPSIAGFVRNAAGAAISGATVTLTSTAVEAAPIVATSNADGAYAIAIPAGSPYIGQPATLTASAPNFGSQSTQITVPSSGPLTPAPSFQLTPTPPATMVVMSGGAYDLTANSALASAANIKLTTVDGTGRTRTLRYVAGSGVVDTLRSDRTADVPFMGAQALYTVTITTAQAGQQTRSLLVNIPASGAFNQGVQLGTLSLTLTGTVYGPGMGTPAQPYALVRVGLGDGTTNAVPTVADAQGNYTLYVGTNDVIAQPGANSYFAADKPGFVPLRGLFSRLVPGVSRTINLWLLPTSAQGNLVEASIFQGGQGLAGVTMDVEGTQLTSTTGPSGFGALFVPWSVVPPGGSFNYGFVLGPGQRYGVGTVMSGSPTYQTTGWTLN